jgi:hypothetical protein
LPVTEQNSAALKTYCNAAAGSGRPVRDTFLQEVGLIQLPQWCKDYNEVLKASAVADVHAHPAWVALLKDQGLDEHEVANKVHYIVNSTIERKECDTAYAAAASMIDIVGHESDGHPVLLRPGRSVEGVLEKLNGISSNTGFILKPYRSLDAITEYLKGQNPEVPPAYFDTVTGEEWEPHAKQLVELTRRLCAGRKPTLLVAEVLPCTLCAPGVLVRDRWKSVPVDKKTSAMYFFNRQASGGGYWEEVSPSVAATLMEKLIVKGCCDLMGLALDCAPDDFLTGPFTTGVVHRLQALLVLFQKLLG